MTEFYSGRCLSFGGARCTVRYFGPVENTKGDWIGVEWDDSFNRGKHNGSHQGKEYFKCISDSPTAASFVRPSRPSDKPLSFLQALEKKYIASDDRFTSPSSEQIRISGKTVEEVGFEKIRQQLATLQELRIVILDNLCIAGIGNHPADKTLDEWNHIRSQGLRIAELDLSRNLFEDWAQIVAICSAVGQSLRVLKLDGNIFRNLDYPTVHEWKDPFLNVVELSLNATHLSWQDIIHILPSFPSLTTLHLSSNLLGPLPTPLPTPHLKTLNLSTNKLTTLHSVSPLTTLPNLTTLSLRSNPLSTISTPHPFPTLKSLDLNSTLLPTLSTLNPIPTTFPSLTSLLITQTPLATTPSAKLHTIARLATLTELNYAPIASAERQNAELYYLSTIAKQLAISTDLTEENRILSEHPRWEELCRIHGEPAIPKKPTQNEPAVNTLAATVTNFTFTITKAHLTTLQKANNPITNPQPPSPNDPPPIQISKLLPRSIDIYRLKGIVGRLFGIRPMSCTLIWETGEWDPIGGQSDDGWSVSEDESDDDDGRGDDRGGSMKERDQTRWQRREMELVDGTREVGFWVEGKEARVRVEVR